MTMRSAANSSSDSCAGARVAMHVALLASLVLMLSGCAATGKPGRQTGLWNVAELRQTPAHTWGARSGLVQEVYYAGAPYKGNPTRVFAYLGRPSQGKGPFPAVLLVHGGGGKAFRDWAEHWAKRGYVALAMDTAGHGPDGRLLDGGPDQNDRTKFREFNDSDVRDMWTYHAVAAVIRGHGLLASLPEVDRRRIGITGISWGGYLTCIVAGIDNELRVAVPVYGCGFLDHNSVWKNGILRSLAPETRARWLHCFDPAMYLAGVRCPILFLNGANDFAYPLDSYQLSYRLVTPRHRWVSIIPGLPHGHIWTFPEVDAFIDNVLGSGPPLPRVGLLEIRGDKVSASYRSPSQLREARLHYTTDTGEWQKRHWVALPATLGERAVVATLPHDRPITFFMSVTDSRGIRVSTEHETMEAPAAQK